MAFLPCPTILMVRKLPVDLSKDEASDLLKYFGAKSVSVMSPKGHMRGTAFAEFGSREEADIALKKLHQAPLFGSRLVVQYSDKNFMPCDAPDSVILPPPSKAAEKPQQTDRQQSKSGSAVDPSLHYLYPPPTSQTLSNISHALVAVPQFYIQVLHLMNKMNLPPPFSKSAEKSIFETTVSLPPPLPSSSESELESDPEEPQELGESKKLEMEKEIFKEKRIATQAFIEKHLPESDRKRKRELSEPAPEQVQTKVNKKVCDEKKDESSSVSVIETVDMELSDTEITESVEDSTVKQVETDKSIQSTHTLQKSEKLTVNVTSEETPTVISKNTDKEAPVKSPVKDKPTSSSEPFIENPTSSAEPFIDKSTSSSEPCNVEEPTLRSVLSSREAGKKASVKSLESAIPQTNLDPESEISVADKMAKLRKEQFAEYQSSVRSKRLTPDQFAEHAVFKKYVKGEPSAKLYVKNLNHKQVVEKDLRDLFMPYFQFYSPEKHDSAPELQIKLMTRGQMKGQAFITFPSVEASEVALSDLHGYVLHGKPMAIMFAKSK